MVERLRCLRSFWGMAGWVLGEGTSKSPFGNIPCEGYSKPQLCTPQPQETPCPRFARPLGVSKVLGLGC